MKLLDSIRNIMIKQFDLIRGFPKPLPMIGLFAQLTPEQKERALAWRGPENLGRRK